MVDSFQGWSNPSDLLPHIILNYLFIYLFLAVLGLRCCTRGFL